MTHKIFTRSGFCLFLIIASIVLTSCDNCNHHYTQTYWGNSYKVEKCDYCGLERHVYHKDAAGYKVGDIRYFKSH